ncbi:MAG TPA: aminotransferase class IV [Candidatus Saccharimonadales bacterium]|nr:aminotransferase class IV [Candidatus Saccharimonadales bacterium]
MANIYDQAYFGEQLIPFKDANLSVASSAILYGLSVYTVFHVAHTPDGMLAFRLPEHFERLQNSAKIIGLEPPTGQWDYEAFLNAAKELMKANQPTRDVFVRASLHAEALLSGTRSRGVKTVFSMFVYDADPIVPRDGARLKTSLWRRIPDIAIPSRAKVNGAYVNSVLARQDAIDSGYDDCIFLDSSGHVCELSAANIFMVRKGVLYTPDTFTDLLEGINRLSIIQLAQDNGIKVVERSIDLTELYIADEVFMSGTSAFLSPVVEVDARPLTAEKSITERLGRLHHDVLHGQAPAYADWLTKLA